MDSGFEPLPPRERGRASKRRRLRAECEEDEGPTPTFHTTAAAVEKVTVADATPLSGAGIDAHAKDIAEVTKGVYADTPQYEYLDHTADVQIHSCTCGCHWGVPLTDLSGCV